MTISERTLRKWRKEALEENKLLAITSWHDNESDCKKLADCQTKILKMTQELLDQHLMRRK